MVENLSIAGSLLKIITGCTASPLFKINVEFI